LFGGLVVALKLNVEFGDAHVLVGTADTLFGDLLLNADDIDVSAESVCVGGPKFDPAGAKNVGNGRGQQFIGGQCLSAADCASGCCAKPCGICSGPGAQFQAGKQGCGFGG